MIRFKRILVAVVGGTVLAFGIALIVLPGPAFVVIPLGLAILAAEFAWARRWLRSARAILPKRRPTARSVQRSIQFLSRQVRRALFPKRKLV